MARLMKIKKHKVALRKGAAESNQVVLVGTYKEKVCIQWVDPLVPEVLWEV